MRIILWLVLIGLVFLALRSKLRVVRPQQPAAFDPRPPAGAARPSETMVSCAQCALYIPAPEAVAESGKVFCCEQHRRQYFSRT